MGNNACVSKNCRIFELRSKVLPFLRPFSSKRFAMTEILK
jgi:hypothetical protein